MALHSSTLAWKIPWTEEPGRLQSMGSQRVGSDWATSLSLFSFTHLRRKWQLTPVFLPWESRDRGAWWAAIYGVAQGWTRLKWLSSSSSLRIIYISHFIKIEMYILVVCCKVKGVIIFSHFFTRHFYYQFVKQQLWEKW